MRIIIFVSFVKINILANKKGCVPCTKMAAYNTNKMGKKLAKVEKLNVNECMIQ